jgi:hypothetical protein
MRIPATAVITAALLLAGCEGDGSRGGGARAAGLWAASPSGPIASARLNGEALRATLRETSCVVMGSGEDRAPHFAIFIGDETTSIQFRTPATARPGAAEMHAAVVTRGDALFNRFLSGSLDLSEVRRMEEGYVIAGSFDLEIREMTAFGMSVRAGEVMEGDPELLRITEGRFADLECHELPGMWAPDLGVPD